MGFGLARATGGDTAEEEGPAGLGAEAAGRWVARAGEVGAGEGLWMKGTGGWGSEKGRPDLRRCARRRAIGVLSLECRLAMSLGRLSEQRDGRIETDARGGKWGFEGVWRGTSGYLWNRAFGVLEAVS